MNLSILVRRVPVFLVLFFYSAFGPTARTFGETTDLDGLAKHLSAVLQTGRIQTVVIGDFSGIEDQVSLQGAFMADRLWFAVLQQEKGFRTLNRGLLHRQVYGHQVTNASFGQAQVEAARVLGAEVLVTGKIERRATELNIAVTAVNVSSGKNISDWTWVVPRTAS